MKKRKIVNLTIMAALICIPSCSQNIDLTNYHSQGDKWSLRYDNIVYSFEYVEKTNDGLYLNISKNDDDYSSDKEYLDRAIYVSHANMFDYTTVMVDNNKVEALIINCVVFYIHVYKVSAEDENKAFFFLQTSSNDFKGYCETEIQSATYDMSKIYFVSISLY